MQIAPGIDAADWKKLDLDDPGNWKTAVSIFERRIRGRFFDAIEFLISDDEARLATERRWGFAVLALDCLLVETLQAFRRGLTDTRNKSKELCVQFLTERSAFKPFFTSPDIATRFYYEFRCGLAHNAQVFGDGRVWSVGALLDLNGKQITVNRTAFHRALGMELDEYLAALRNGLPPELRELPNQDEFYCGGQVLELANSRVTLTYCVSRPRFRFSLQWFETSFSCAP